MVVLSIDIGSSSIKIGAISIEGRLLAYKNTPLPNKKEFLISAWESSLTSLSEIYHELSRPSLCGISICSQNPSLIALDKKDKPLASPFFDRLDDYSSNNLSFFIPLINHIKKNYPEIYNKTSLFLTPSNYISYLLTGCPSLPIPETFKEYFWNERSLEENNISKEKLPKLTNMFEPVGKISQEIAKRLNIPPEILIFNSSVDYFAALIGSDSQENHTILNRTGTSEGINLIIKESRNSPSPYLFPHIFPELKTLGVIHENLGKLMSWYREEKGLYYLDYTTMITLILQEKLPSNIETLLKDNFNYEEIIKQLTYNFLHQNSPFSLGRVILEIFIFHFKRVIEQYREQGYPIHRVKISGGQGFCKPWVRFKANRSNLEIEVPEIINTELLGGAILAFNDKKEFSNIYEAMSNLYRVKEVIA